jgi:hypothetical protein
LPPETEVDVTPEGGKGGNVTVGAGVSVNVAVGGIGVAVGMAAWVSAIIVKAAAAIVFCMSTALTVGIAVVSALRAPHALTLNASIITRVRLEKHFIWTSPYRFRFSRIGPLPGAIPFITEAL